MDSEDCAHGAPREGFAQFRARAHGSRRVTLEMRAWLDRADSFKGLPQGTAKPLTFLFAFKDAEPYLGLPAHTYKLIDWLVGLTKPQDWEEGSRPIAWPEARRQEEFLGLSQRRTQELNRALQEAGIFVMRDDPQGRRYGHRDPKTGRITKAFGFDLSLLMERHEEFKKVAVEAQIERNRMKKLRRQKTIARRAIDQAAEELAALGHDSETLQRLVQEADDLVKAASQCRSSEELGMAVKALERWKEEVQQMLRDLIKPVETAPMGAENDTHDTYTTLNSNELNHTVNHNQARSGVAVPPVPDDQAAPEPQLPETLHITPATLVELAPRLAPYMPARTAAMTWLAVFEAAAELAAEMGISRTLWARAWHVMGREYAAVAIAIVSTWPQDHFTSGPGGYFAGMLRKFEKNPQDLCLARTLWRLKDQIWGKEGHKERRQLEKARQRRSSAPRPPMIKPGGGSAPVATVPQPRPVAALLPPPTPPALPAPVNNAAANSGTSKSWQNPSFAMREETRQIVLRMRQHQQQREEWNKSAFAKPENTTAIPARPNNGDEGCPSRS
jgi:replication initiation protein RepC